MRYPILILQAFGLLGALFIFSLNGAFGDFGYGLDKPTRHTIKISGMKFVPNELTVKVGDTVVWLNKDFYDHDVTDEKNKTWSSGPFGQNKSWSKVITTDEQYFCSLHVVMKGTIKVE
jgi:plastocyanin